ncbi:MAG: hypothetical protein FWG46_07245 [Treponema sp.]|nr:hypothetical protein [Treponema sp.]
MEKTFSEKMMDLLDQGVAASKEFAIKAGAKAQDIGERGILMVEIKQLENKAKKMLGQLGNEVYRAFVEHNQETLDRNAPEVQTIIKELSDVRDALEQKETELKTRR